MRRMFGDVPILQFHNVTEADAADRLWLPLRAFTEYLSHLMAGGYDLIPLDEAIAQLKDGGRSSRKRPISLTFDHGYAAFYDHVFPLLKAARIPATVLISPDRVGKTSPRHDGTVEHLDAAQLTEIADSGIEVGAYEDGAWNINRIDPATVGRHVREYKGRLEEVVGRKVEYFGVKEGVPSAALRDLLVSTGYRAFLTQCPTHRGLDPFAVGRIQVDDDDFNIFLTKISRTYLFFKDKRSWRYIREYKLDRVAHRLSEAFDRVKGKRHGA